MDIYTYGTLTTVFSGSENSAVMFVSGTADVINYAVYQGDIYTYDLVNHHCHIDVLQSSVFKSLYDFKTGFWTPGNSLTYGRTYPSMYSCIDLLFYVSACIVDEYDGEILVHYWWK